MSACLQRFWTAYFFDLDGTLVDTAPDLHKALTHALKTYHYPLVDESLTRQFIGHGAQVMIERAIEHHDGDATDVSDVLTAFLDYYGEHTCVESKPYPTVTETLTALKARGAKLAVVTNKRKRFADLIVEALGWSDIFDLVVGGDTAENPKPASDPIDLTCMRLAMSTREVLFIGDSKTDVGAARAAGVPVVCVRDGYNEGIDAEALGADCVIDRFSELIPA